MKRKKNRCTGFPSPAADFEKAALSLDKLLIHNPSATFFMKMKGRAMVLAGIYPNDILIIDRSLPFENEDVVVAIINNQYFVRRWMKYQNGGLIQLMQLQVLSVLYLQQVLEKMQYTVLILMRMQQLKVTSILQVLKCSNRKIKILK